jgi:hypothetical protein
MNIVGLASKQECAVAAFDNGNFVTSEEIVHRRFVDPPLLLKLVDGEAILAATGRPLLVTPSGFIHCAYT